MRGAAHDQGGWRTAPPGEIAAVVAVLVALALGGCVGPPWYLGSPLDDRKVIPNQSRALTVAEHRRVYLMAHAEERAFVELQELLALEERGALRPAEHKRLIELLAARVRDWSVLGRALALAADLRHLVALAPGEPWRSRRACAPPSSRRATSGWRSARTRAPSRSIGSPRSSEETR